MARLLDLDPVPTLLIRVRAELSADFGDRPVRVSRAPGRLDVMGGIADYTGSLVCELPLDRAAAIALQERDDRQVQVFSFNLLDEHKPFALRIPLESLATQSSELLAREFDQPGRKWAGYMIGCLHALNEQGYVDLRDEKIKGLNLAVHSTVPLGAGVSSSAAIEVATMMNLVEHFGIGRDVMTIRGAPDVRGGAAHSSKEVTGRETASDVSSASPQGSFRCSRQHPFETRAIDALRFAALCQRVEHRICLAPCGIMDQVATTVGEQGSLMRMVCQPHEVQPPLPIPRGMRFVGINSNVKHSVGGGAYGRTRCAAFMAHKMILEFMRRGGKTMGRELIGDPMRGYLANLDPHDYKQHFRPRLPEFVKGADFLRDFGPTIDTATRVNPDETYAVQHAADHHVLEAQRVRQFAEYLEQADRESDPLKRGPLLDRAGHLMYASHLSYTNDAMLGAPECDLIVDLVRAREKKGLYGAKITGGGSGGTVAILCETGENADAALADVMAEYQKQTGNTPALFTGSSDGAWKVGTAVVA